MKCFLRFFLICLSIKTIRTHQNCDQIFEFQKQYIFSRTVNAYLSVVIPKNIDNEFRLKVLFYFPFKVESAADLPEISLETERANRIANDISEGNPVKFLIKIKPSQKNWLKVGRVTLDNTIICDSSTVFSGVKAESNAKFVLTSSGVSVKPLNTEDEDEEACGNYKLNTPFIISGQRRKKEKWPWIAGILIEEEYQCSATLISRTRAITAAHCLTELSFEDIYLLIFTERSINVIDYETHPNFRKAPKYDIAVLLTERISESNFVPICLPNDGVSLLGRSGRIITWTPNEPENKPALYDTELTVVHSDDCQGDFGALETHTFCARHGYQDSYLCNGDSGGGFMVKNKISKRWFLRGIVSAGVIDPIDGDCRIGDYVVFTDVIHFMNFLNNV